jgi:hypothetical protein
MLTPSAHAARLTDQRLPIVLEHAGERRHTLPSVTTT